MGISAVNDEPNGNTIFIKGRGSGIGRGFAETLHGKGNKVIISGRRKSAREAVGRVNPGIEFVELDIENAKSVNPSPIRW
jgi:uncharacterized oxidoreductase